MWLIVCLLVASAVLVRWLWERSGMGKSAAVVSGWPGPPTQPLVGNSLQLKKDAELAKQFIESVHFCSQYTG